MLKKVLQYKNTIYSITLVVIYLFIANYNYSRGYLTDDVNHLKLSLGNTNIVIGVVFFLTSLFLLLKQYKSRKIEKRSFHSLLFYILISSIFIFTSINEIIANASLVLNNLYTSEDTIQRVVKIGYYDHEKEEIILLSNDFNNVPLEISKYEKIQNKTHVDVELHAGLLNIPKNPKIVIN